MAINADPGDVAKIKDYMRTATESAQEISESLRGEQVSNINNIVGAAQGRTGYPLEKSSKLRGLFNDKLEVVASDMDRIGTRSTEAGDVVSKFFDALENGDNDAAAQVISNVVPSYSVD